MAATKALMAAVGAATKPPARPQRVSSRASTRTRPRRYEDEGLEGEAEGYKAGEAAAGEGGGKKRARRQGGRRRRGRQEEAPATQGLEGVGYLGG